MPPASKLFFAAPEEEESAALLLVFPSGNVCSASAMAAINSSPRSSMALGS